MFLILGSIPKTPNGIYCVLFWNIQFNDTIRYDCEEGTWIENDTLSVPRDNYLDVKCLNINGTYDIPTEWPNCTITVNCGQPPEPPVNGSR